MIKALERVGKPIPQELSDMSKNFKEKVGRGEAHWSTGGFVGKGFSFDASEMNENQKAVSLQRRAYEIEQGIIPEGNDEDETGEYDDTGFIRLENEKEASTPSDENTNTSEMDGEAEDFDDPSVKKIEKSLVTPQDLMPIIPTNLTPLERAKALAASLGLNKALYAAPLPALPSSLSILPPTSMTADGKVDTKTALARAKAIAQQMSTIKAIDPVTGKILEVNEQFYIEEYEINDYPAQVSINLIVYHIYIISYIN
jgi:hypothetical protein